MITSSKLKFSSITTLLRLLFAAMLISRPIYLLGLSELLTLFLQCRQDSDPIPGIPHPEAHSPRKPGGSTSALPAKATSWSSMGSNLSTGSQQSSVSANRAGSRKNTVNEALHGRSPNPSEASAWEEGFRAGQEASFFADECDAMLWQDLLLSKLTRATKHFSFTDFAEIADYVADVADDKSLVADAPDWPVRMVAEAEKVIGIAPALPWTQPAASSGFGPVFVSQQTAAPKADKLGWRQQKPGDLAVDWRMAEAEQLMPHLSLADEAQDNYYLQAGDVQEINRVVDLAVGEVQDQVPTIKTPPAQEVNQRIELPKLGSDLGVGSVSIRPGTMKGVKLPSQLGIDLGNDDQIMVWGSCTVFL